MKHRLQADLEAHIEGWIQTNCEEGDWPQIWVDDKLHVRMADAAAAVFDAVLAGQEFAKSQEA